MHAGVEDFDSTPIRIMMEPDEQAQRDYQFTVKVVADQINEADQNFVLILRLEDAIRRESVSTTMRNATRCIIRDDDRMYLHANCGLLWSLSLSFSLSLSSFSLSLSPAITIGFEKPLYQFVEPQFDTEFLVFVIKSNNQTTEQTLDIFVQIEFPNTTLPRATPEVDFRIGLVGKSHIDFCAVSVYVCTYTCMCVSVRVCILCVHSTEWLLTMIVLHKV